MQMRDYRADDIPAIHAINDAEVPAVGSATPDHLAHIASQSVIALVAEIDDQIAGFCFVLAPGADYDSRNYAWFAARYDDFVYLDRVAIAPAFQRRGIGRAMYAHVEHLTAVRRPSASDFTLEVNIRPRNDGSLAFHTGLGFVEVGQRETDYDTQVSMMTRQLRN